MAMEYFFNADNHALSWFVVPVNGFSSARLINMTIFVAETSFYGRWDGLGTSYCYFAGIVVVPHCTMVASCIHTLLEAILLIKRDK